MNNLNYKNLTFKQFTESFLSDSTIPDSLFTNFEYKLRPPKDFEEIVEKCFTVLDNISFNKEEDITFNNINTTIRVLRLLQRILFFTDYPLRSVYHNRLLCLSLSNNKEVSIQAFKSLCLLDHVSIHNMNHMLLLIKYADIPFCTYSNTNSTISITSNYTNSTDRYDIMRRLSSIVILSQYIINKEDILKSISYKEILDILYNGVSKDNILNKEVDTNTNNKEYTFCLEAFFLTLYNFNLLDTTFIKTYLHKSFKNREASFENILMFCLSEDTGIIETDTIYKNLDCLYKYLTVIYDNREDTDFNIIIQNSSLKENLISIIQYEDSNCLELIFKILQEIYKNREEPFCDSFLYKMCINGINDSTCILDTNNINIPFCINTLAYFINNDPFSVSSIINRIPVIFKEYNNRIVESFINLLDAVSLNKEIKEKCIKDKILSKFLKECFKSNSLINSNDKDIFNYKAFGEYIKVLLKHHPCFIKEFCECIKDLRIYNLQGLLSILCDLQDFSEDKFVESICMFISSSDIIEDSHLRILGFNSGREKISMYFISRLIESLDIELDIEDRNKLGIKLIDKNLFIMKYLIVHKDEELIKLFNSLCIFLPKILSKVNNRNILEYLIEYPNKIKKEKSMDCFFTTKHIYNKSKVSYSRILRRVYSIIREIVHSEIGSYKNIFLIYFINTLKEIEESKEKLDNELYKEDGNRIHPVNKHITNRINLVNEHPSLKKYFKDNKENIPYLLYILHNNRRDMKSTTYHMYLEWILKQGRRYYTDDYIYKIIMKNKYFRNTEVVELILKFLLSYNTNDSIRIIKYLNSITVEDRSCNDMVELYRRHFCTNLRIKCTRMIDEYINKDIIEGKLDSGDKVNGIIDSGDNNNTIDNIIQSGKRFKWRNEIILKDTEFYKFYYINRYVVNIDILINIYINMKCINSIYIRLINHILFICTYSKKDIQLPDLSNILKSTKIGKILKIKYCISYIKYMRSMKKEYLSKDIILFLIHLKSLKINKKWVFVKCLIYQIFIFEIEHEEFIGSLKDFIDNNISLGYWNLDLFKKKLLGFWNKGDIGIIKDGRICLDNIGVNSIKMVKDNDNINSNDVTPITTTTTNATNINYINNLKLFMKFSIKYKEYFDILIDFINLSDTCRNLITNKFIRKVFDLILQIQISDGISQNKEYESGCIFFEILLSHSNFKNIVLNICKEYLIKTEGDKIYNLVFILYRTLSYETAKYIIEHGILDIILEKLSSSKEEDIYLKDNPDCMIKVQYSKYIEVWTRIKDKKNKISYIYRFINEVYCILYPTTCLHEDSSVRMFMSDDTYSEEDEIVEEDYEYPWSYINTERELMGHGEIDIREYIRNWCVLEGIKDDNRIESEQEEMDVLNKGNSSIENESEDIENNHNGLYFYSDESEYDIFLGDEDLSDTILEDAISEESSVGDENGEVPELDYEFLNNQSDDILIFIVQEYYRNRKRSLSSYIPINKLWLRQLKDNVRYLFEEQERMLMDELYYHPKEEEIKEEKKCIPYSSYWVSFIRAYVQRYTSSFYVLDICQVISMNEEIWKEVYEEVYSILMGNEELDKEGSDDYVLDTITIPNNHLPYPILPNNINMIEKCLEILSTKPLKKSIEFIHFLIKLSSQDTLTDLVYDILSEEDFINLPKELIRIFIRKCPIRLFYKLGLKVINEKNIIIFLSESQDICIVTRIFIEYVENKYKEEVSFLQKKYKLRNLLQWDAIELWKNDLYGRYNKGVLSKELFDILREKLIDRKDLIKGMDIGVGVEGMEEGKDIGDKVEDINTNTTDNIFMSNEYTAFGIYEAFVNLLVFYSCPENRIQDFIELRQLFDSRKKQVENIKEKEIPILLKYNIIKPEDKMSFVLKNIKPLYFGEMKMVVRRKLVLQDSFTQIIRKDPKEIKQKKLRIYFENEDGEDYGGLTKEWIEILIDQISNIDKGLFTYSSDSKQTLLPYSGSCVQGDHLLYYKFLGRILGKCILDNHKVGIKLDRIVYKYLLNIRSTLIDLKDIDKQYYNSLYWILNNSIENILHLYFIYEYTEYGNTYEIEMIPNGRNILVTDINKREYIDLIVKYKLYKNIEKQLEAIKIGLYEIVDDTIQILNEEELENLIYNGDYINIDMWMNNTIYEGYTRSSQVCIWYWKIVENMSVDERSRLLKFSTGTPRLTTSTRPFCIRRVSYSIGRLPSAHTCFNTIDMPEYTSYEEMKKCIMYAIYETSGFGFI